MKILLLIFIVLSLAKEDYYKILGLKKGADLESVKKQFRKLSLKYHPDKNNSPGANEQYKKITHAYQEIIDGNADKDDDEIPFNKRGYSQHYTRTYTFTDDPFRRNYQYQTYTEFQNQRNDSFLNLNSIFLVGIFLIIGFLIVNFVTNIPQEDGGQNNSKNNQYNNQKQQENQQNKNQAQDNQYQQQQAESKSKQSELFRQNFEIKEKVSNVSSYTESNHRFQFYENFNQ
ncbi:unnamed protein product [Paramecium sonneborni]|uniref:J domain-containing protein n=1 Tax=Paramecium sonneborni TaxID=65129 RepID=A0A8S1LJL3_9CILI|nr:unnamed protein product [Paramecium sonneborni]